MSLVPVEKQRLANVIPKLIAVASLDSYNDSSLISRNGCATAPITHLELVALIEAAKAAIA